MVQKFVEEIKHRVKEQHVAMIDIINVAIFWFVKAHNLMAISNAEELVTNNP